MIGWNPTTSSAKDENTMSVDEGDYILCLLPIYTTNDLRTWKRLHQEIRRFKDTGILHPVENRMITDDECYQNHTVNPIRIIPLPLYSRILSKPNVSKRLLFPYTSGRLLIKHQSSHTTKELKSNTDYVRLRYDKWYWNMKVRRTPSVITSRAPSNMRIESLPYNFSSDIHMDLEEGDRC
jgi:hypothetical protein